MAATLSSPTALPLCRPHGCHTVFPHCPAIVQTTWLSHCLPPLPCHSADHMSHCLPPLPCHCADHSHLSKRLSLSKSIWPLFSSMEWDPSSINFLYFSKKNLYFIKLPCWSCFYIFIMVFCKFLQQHSTLHCKWAVIFMTVLPVHINQEQWGYTAQFHKISTHLGTTAKFWALKGWYEGILYWGPTIIRWPSINCCQTIFVYPCSTALHIRWN